MGAGAEAPDLRRRGAEVSVALVDGRVMLTAARGANGRRVRLVGEAESLGDMARELSGILGITAAADAAMNWRCAG